MVSDRECVKITPRTGSAQNQQAVCVQRCERVFAMLATSRAVPIASAKALQNPSPSCVTVCGMHNGSSDATPGAAGARACRQRARCRCGIRKYAANPGMRSRAG